jgi:hypothetical protein
MALGQGQLRVPHQGAEHRQADAGHAVLDQPVSRSGCPRGQGADAHPRGLVGGRNIPYAAAAEQV